jgi:hypothetical protein
MNYGDLSFSNQDYTQILDTTSLPDLIQACLVLAEIEPKHKAEDIETYIDWSQSFIYRHTLTTTFDRLLANEQELDLSIEKNIQSLVKICKLGLKQIDFGIAAKARELLTRYSINFDQTGVPDPKQQDQLELQELQENMAIDEKIATYLEALVTRSATRPELTNLFLDIPVNFQANVKNLEVVLAYTRLIHESAGSKQCIRTCLAIERQSPGLLNKMYKKYGLVPAMDTNVLHLEMLDKQNLDAETYLDDIEQRDEWSLELLSVALQIIRVSANSKTKLDFFKALEKKSNQLEKVKSKLVEQGDTSKIYKLQEIEQIISNMYSWAQDSVAKRLRVRCQNFPLNDTYESKEFEALVEILPSDIDVKALLASWATHTDKGPRIKQNIDRILELEKVQPGAAAKLQKDYGIQNFERYPLEVLLDQCRNESEPKPTVLILNPYSDWNGAFSHNIILWESVHKQLTQLGYDLRVVEAGSKVGAIRQLAKVHSRYGRIEGAIIGGHGTATSIRFGDNPNGVVSLNDLDMPGVEPSTRIFSRTAPIGLNACSTGELDGFAKKISKLDIHKVIAPEIPTPIKSIEITKNEDGSLNFNIEYDESDAGRTFTRYS